MCRFLLVKSKKKKDMKDLVLSFSHMSEKSRTEEGDRQEDGWGISWFGGKRWNTKKSLDPIWEEEDVFEDIPDTKLLAVHARSASFDDTKGKIDYNQPYIKDRYAFVFNGLLRGVGLGRKVEGEIGAQKIWNLILDELNGGSPHIAIKKVSKLLSDNSKKIRGLNIGLSDGKNLYAYCHRYGKGDYFALRKYEDKEKFIISSEPIGDFRSEKIRRGELIAL